MQPEQSFVLLRWEELLLRVVVFLQFVLSLLWRDCLQQIVAVVLFHGRTETQFEL